MKKYYILENFEEGKKSIISAGSSSIQTSVRKGKQLKGLDLIIYFNDSEFEGSLITKDIKNDTEVMKIQKRLHIEFMCFLKRDNNEEFFDIHAIFCRIVHEVCDTVGRPIPE